MPAIQPKPVVPSPGQTTKNVDAVSLMALQITCQRRKHDPSRKKDRERLAFGPQVCTRAIPFLVRRADANGLSDHLSTSSNELRSERVMGCPSAKRMTCPPQMTAAWTAGSRLRRSMTGGTIWARSCSIPTCTAAFFLRGLENIACESRRRQRPSSSRTVFSSLLIIR
jgi:hypothetical protein